MRSSFAAVAVVAIALSLARPAAARNYDVAAGAQLNELIGSRSTRGTAKDGDRIHLHGPGPFVAPQGGWVIRRSLEILGDGPGQTRGNSSTVLRPYSNASSDQNDPVLVLDLSDTPAEGNLDYVHIHDLQIGRTAAPTANVATSNGISFIPGRDEHKFLTRLRLERVAVTNMANDGVHLEGRGGKYGITGVSIVDCDLGWNARHGLFVENATVLSVLGVNCFWNHKNGARIFACIGARILNSAFSQNCVDAQSGGQLEIGCCNAFLVQGDHFEDFDHHAPSLTAFYAYDCDGGTIASCVFSSGKLVPGSRGVFVGYPPSRSSGIVVGSNVYTNVDVSVEIADAKTITSCTIFPQVVDIQNNTSGAAARVIVPDAPDRGHVVFAPSAVDSNLTAGIAFPRLSRTKRDAMVAAARGGPRREGLVIYDDADKRLNHWDGKRWLEDAAYFPSDSTSATAAPGGIKLPAVLTSATRDRIPSESRVKGALIYNTTTNMLNFWDGTSWREVGVKAGAAP